MTNNFSFVNEELKTLKRLNKMIQQMVVQKYLDLSESKRRFFKNKIIQQSNNDV